jgi:hypothetical protein
MFFDMRENPTKSEKSQKVEVSKIEKFAIFFNFTKYSNSNIPIISTLLKNGTPSSFLMKLVWRKDMWKKNKK